VKKESYLDLNNGALEDKLAEKKLKLLNLRSDYANRKLKNVKEINSLKKDIARILFTLGLKKKETKVTAEVEAKAK
jgi:ribosomal protein L29